MTPIIDKALLAKSSAGRGSSGEVHYLETNTLCCIKSIHIAPMSKTNGRFSETRYFLSPEIHEKICQRRAMGWNAVHSVHLEAPFCENHEQVAKVVVCKQCRGCDRNGLCGFYFNKGITCYAGSRLLSAEDYNDEFLEYFW